MRLLLFLSRLALICNVFFLLTVLLQWRNLVEDKAALSTILIIGYVFAMLINPLVNLFYIGLILFRKPLRTTVPGWLVVTNFIFLIVQLQYILFLNDTPHH